MDEKGLHRRIAELAEALSGPGPRQPQASQGTYVSQSPPASGEPEDLLDYIRLQLKYVIFDLEATRRENRYLREMLERRGNPGEGADPV
jgi:hypothetical protein